MFKKRKPVRRDNVRVTQYEEVTDWEAVGGAVFIGVLVLAVLSSCAG